MKEIPVSLDSAHKNNISEASIPAARDVLLANQNADGHWCFELEADCTIPAEYVLMMHALDEIDVHLENKIGVYLRERQTHEGGWSLYTGGKVNLSCTVQTYYALKLIGDSPQAAHMLRARQCILNMGGAAKANVFTRFTLALFGQVPWRAVPFMAVELMLFPRVFPIHLSKMSYWSRAVMVPLLILYSLKASAKNPRQIHIPELFILPADQETHYFQTQSFLGWLFLKLDRFGRLIEPLIPKKIRKKAIARAEHWCVQRLNGEGGLGAIFPAMASVYHALQTLGYSKTHPLCRQTRIAFQKLLVIRSTEAYCQPCVSPVWDTAITSLVLQRENSLGSRQACQRSLAWLQSRQIISPPADWCDYNPDLTPGGWAFEYKNDYYPDLDDTAMVAMALHQHLVDNPNSPDQPHFQQAITLAANWLVGMQSKNGGFAAFDKNNTYHYLNDIPFADHGALLDPPTADVTARCLMLLARLQRPEDQITIQKALQFLLQQQEKNGAWFGRWGTNYLYGTWSVLIALQAVGLSKEHPAVIKAIHWLRAKQHQDGGWGESNDSYWDATKDQHPSTSFQTAWALLGLMAAGEAHSTAVAQGIQYLLRTQTKEGNWADPYFNAPGFPRMFYLRYYGYATYFPLWALAEYRHCTISGAYAKEPNI